MNISLDLKEFTWPGGPAAIGKTMASIAQRAEASGFYAIWAMDHFLQLPFFGPAENDMPECYSLLNFIAGHTERVKLGVMVTGVTYRHPGFLVKQVITPGCPLRRSRVRRNRRGMIRARTCRPGFPIPPARRALPPSRGNAPDRAEDVVGRSHTFRGSVLPVGRADLRATAGSPAVAAHPPRGIGRAEDVALRGALCRCLQRFRRGLIRTTA